MTEATMRGLLRPAATRAPLLALLAFSTVFASAVCSRSAHAQTTTQSANQAIDANLVVRKNGKIIENGTLVFTDIVDCGGQPRTSDGSDFEFSVTYTANVPVVELWLGVGTGENCATLSNRLRPANNAALPPVCTFLGSVTSNTRNPILKIKGSQLFDQSGRANREDPGPSTGTDGFNGYSCDAVSGSPAYTIYLLPLQTETTSINGSEPSTIGTLSTLRATFSPYTRRPAAPTSLSGRSGETQIGVSFKAPSSSMTLTQYRAYFDVGGGQGSGIGGGTGDAVDAGSTADMSGGLDAGADASVAQTEDAGTNTGAPITCGGGLLEGNKDPPINQPASIIRATKKSTSTSVALTDLSGVPIDQVIAVSAVAIDPAGNESLLSDPVCVPRVETDGFLDACSNIPGCRSEFDSCSLSPGRTGSTMGLSLLALALAALIRRRGRA